LEKRKAGKRIIKSIPEKKKMLIPEDLRKAIMKDMKKDGTKQRYTSAFPTYSIKKEEKEKREGKKHRHRIVAENVWRRYIDINLAG
jgi:replication-associated recombination protein RarA